MSVRVYDVRCTVAFCSNRDKLCFFGDNLLKRYRATFFLEIKQILLFFFLLLDIYNTVADPCYFIFGSNPIKSGDDLKLNKFYCHKSSLRINSLSEQTKLKTFSIFLL